ncbi:hypothetical protein [Pseudoalteromonas fuliginea]|uniref:Uncharacterized protein n=1 Tax=Pseudoalteromonas fuliginea TaxID=1872678 RepID=A0ABQ6RMM1_9GAMM|nr:hypothetical protein [Pseudoalteromonas fuliginea]KAA1164707.1 hypothetical protein EU509_01710 [Pseudoalteromonas fuliginea]KAA1169318.1 hypothetical protein EUZ79_01820 [Pseudoalteromonas fuliginea]
MKKLILSMVLLVLGFFMGYISKPTYEQPTLDQKYGVLRIPIPIDCSQVVGEISDSHIKSIELVSFDLGFKTIYADKYLRIEHTGYPDNILKVINSSLSECLIDKSFSYDNVSMIAMDLQEHFNTSTRSPVYVIIKDGKAIVNFKSE